MIDFRFTRHFVLSLAPAVLAGLAGCAAWEETVRFGAAPNQVATPTAADGAEDSPSLPVSTAVPCDQVVALPPIDAEPAPPLSPSAQAAADRPTPPADGFVTQVQYEAPVENSQNSTEPATSLPQSPTPAEETPRPAADPPSAVDSGIPDAAPIDLGVALQLTAGQNPQVAFARAQINEAYAQLQAAQVLWLPTIRYGASYNKHEGRIQDVAGRVFSTNRTAGYAGLGIRAVGAGSPSFPGISMNFKLSDAIYDPRIATRRTQARRQTAAAVVNDELLQSATAYLDLLAALQLKSVAMDTVYHSEELARVTADFAQAGQGTQGDADRAAASLAVQRNRLIRAEADIIISSARLAQQLSLDPGLLVEPQEPTLAPIQLQTPDQPLPNLVATGLSNRPELSASRLLVEEAVQRLTRERHAPWLPSLFMGMDYGGMGGGFNNDITDSGQRWDMDAIAYWEVRNLGFGERAARNEAGAQVSQARSRQVEVMDVIAREIVEAQVEVVAQQEQIKIAEAAVAAAEASFRRNLERIEQLQGLPIEALQSILALDEARREYVRAITDYNIAQFRLQRALGWPVQAPSPPQS